MSYIYSKKCFSKLQGKKKREKKKKEFILKAMGMILKATFLWESDIIYFYKGLSGSGRGVEHGKKGTSCSAIVTLQFKGDTGLRQWWWK